jgi:hypothetical protein
MPRTPADSAEGPVLFVGLSSVGLAGEGPPAETASTVGSGLHGSAPAGGGKSGCFCKATGSGQEGDKEADARRGAVFAIDGEEVGQPSACQEGCKADNCEEGREAGTGQEDDKEACAEDPDL